jgi:hypothetical protein
MKQGNKFINLLPILTCALVPMSHGLKQSIPKYMRTLGTFVTWIELVM